MAEIQDFHPDLSTDLGVFSLKLYRDVSIKCIRCENLTSNDSLLTLTPKVFISDDSQNIKLYLLHRLSSLVSWSRTNISLIGRMVL